MAYILMQTHTVHLASELLVGYTGQNVTPET